MSLPENILRAMHKRPVFAPYAPPARAVTKAAPEPDDDLEPPDAFTGHEKLLHRDFAADMQRRGVHVVHARTDMVSTIEAGTPDFHCMFFGEDGWTRGCAVEFKVAGKKLSTRQRDCIREMRRKRIPVIVAWALKDAIDFAKEVLKA